MNGSLPPSPESWGGRPIIRCVADAEPRHRVVVTGTVGTVEMRRWRGVQTCTARLDDGTGRLTLVFTRPDPLPGLAEGMRCTVEGTVLTGETEPTVWDPVYRFEI
ncbi:MAG TPA: hypothetical protein VMV22_08640 [Acidimicrobiales bacterium]|nr:hypothetical protein [Acidimicrobiales bacterium]